MRKLLLIPLLFLILVISYFLYSYVQEQKLARITSFAECSAAGYPIMTSYPARCAPPNGKSFTEDIGNELEYSQEILIENPRPNQKVQTKPFLVKGRARGNWFFEGSFSGEVFDSHNNSLGTVILTAEEEWMTENFVSFSGEVGQISPSTEKGKLIISNANPSGLPENKKELIIPLQFTK